MTVQEYRLLLTGSRYIRRRDVVREELTEKLSLAVELGRTLIVVHGDCPDQTGADKTADIWAVEQSRQGKPVRTERHPAKNHPTRHFGDWPECGPRRNQYMVDLDADECLAFIDRCTSMRCRRPDVHPSHGTMDCVNRALKARILVHKVELWEES